MTPDYLCALMNTGWTIKRSSTGSSWYRYKEGEGRFALKDAEVWDAINSDKLEFVNPKTKLTLRVKQ